MSNTLGLSQITNDAAATIKFLEAYGQYFDKWFITVADKDKKQYKILDEFLVGKEKPEFTRLSYFKWTDDFAAARNANLKTIDTDYFFWADSDDTIDKPDRLTELVRYMATSDIDVIQLKYDYAQNEAGQAISDHWRERIIKRSYEGHWDAPVHETFQGPPAKVERSDAIVVKHDKDPEAMGKSMARNEKILRKHFKDTKDPRDAYYLGMTELAARNYEQAIAWLMQHIATAGSEEDMYRSWCRIADAEWAMGKNQQSLYATDEAIKLRPAFPDAYYIKVMNYVRTEDYSKAIEWLQVAMQKPVPDTLHMIDPTLYTHRGMAMGAIAFLFSGQVKEAFKLYNAVLQQDPTFYDKEKAVDGVDWQAIYEDAYFDAKAIDYTKWLLHYTKGVGGKPSKLFEALPARILADARLNAERVKFLPKVVWPKKSIAIYTGQNSEPWGPDTLSKGMGGSEEAVVYLSRELAKLGWQVTVFNDRDDEYMDPVYGTGRLSYPDYEPGDDIVVYKPWTLLNPYDEFDVFWAWRNPSLPRALDIKARKIIVDMHDYPLGHQTVTKADVARVDVFMLKTKFQRRGIPDVPDDKIVIIPNGLVTSQFEGSSEKRKHSVGWFSSYDRGIDTLLSIWPKIVEAVPDVTLDLAYGWTVYDLFHSKNAERMKWKWQMIREFNKYGVKEHGRLSHIELADLMQTTQVLAYPTSFPEIDCITVKKAQAAKMDVVTSGYAALQESIIKDEPEIEGIHDKPEALEAFADRLIEALLHPESEETLEKRKQQIFAKYDWAVVAQAWDKVMQ